MNITRKREIRTSWLNFKLTHDARWLVCALSWIIFGRHDGFNRQS